MRSWLQSLAAAWSRSNKKRRAVKKPFNSGRGRPVLEGLEDRCVPATYIVNSAIDLHDWMPNDGEASTDSFTSPPRVSLRAAIEAANENADQDTIVFDFTKLESQTINLRFGTLVIKHQVTIDGTKDGKPYVVLNGDKYPSTAGIKLEASDSIIKGLVIQGFGDTGIIIAAGANRNTIQGNYIGTDAAGEAIVANWGHGIIVRGSDNTIGGTKDGEGNLIAGTPNPELAGIAIVGATATKNKVQGNKIGTDHTGMRALPNAGVGVLIKEASGNTIGGTVGTTPGQSLHGAGNLISGNRGFGDTAATHRGAVQIQGSGANNNTVQGNFIGVAIDGRQPLSNRGHGILILGGASKNLIGGTTPEARNVISGNDITGVMILGLGTNENKVQGNYIGLRSDATLIGIDKSVGNGVYGVWIKDGAQKNLIGGEEGTTEGGGPTGAANAIAFNGQKMENPLKGHGIVIEGQNTIGNAIRRNSIFKNEGRGIDLADDTSPYNSFLFNDPRKIEKGSMVQPPDKDDGPNELQNHAFVERVNPSSNTIEWVLNSTPNTTFTIDVFRDPQNAYKEYGEGEIWLRSITKTTDDWGNVRFTTNEGIDKITLTVTDKDGNTSEFSLMDTDGDGLADTWETSGIDLDEDGTPEFSLDGARVDHKDVYVEVDAMMERGPHQKDLDRVVQVFAQAPADLVHNPDGTQGIDLHVLFDEKDIPRKAFGTNWDKEFGPVKIAHFGRLTEHGDQDLLFAKRLVYRYALFADTYGDPLDSPQYYFSGGATEHRGDDIIITLGSPKGHDKAGNWYDGYLIIAGEDKVWGTDDDRADKGSDQEWGLRKGSDGQWHDDDIRRSSTPDHTVNVVVATFMHELGHSLGLRHGGGGTDWRGKGDDNWKNKAGYFSVMNYFADRSKLPWDVTTYGPWPDYSHASPDDWAQLTYSFLETGQFNYGQADVFLATPEEELLHAPNLVVSMTAAQDPVDNSLTYTITVSNNGSYQATGVKLIDLLPENVVLVSASSSQGICVVSDNAVVCELSDLPISDSAMVTIKVIPLVAGTLTNTIGVLAEEVDQNPEDNYAILETVIIEIGNVVPIGTDDFVLIPANVAVMIPVLNNDLDYGGNLDVTSLSVGTPPGRGAAIPNQDGTITYVPDGPFTGTVTFTYTVQDNLGAVSNPATVTVNVTSDPPSAANDTAATPADTPVLIHVLANDSDADLGLKPGSVAIVTPPATGSLVVHADGSITYTPEGLFIGDVVFTYTVRDKADVVSNEATVSVTVTKPNQPPAASNDVAETIMGEPITIHVLNNDRDSDGMLDPTSLAIETAPSYGNVQVNLDGTITYTPGEIFGDDTFSYRVRDNQGRSSDTAIVTVTIRMPDTGPVVISNGLDSGAPGYFSLTVEKGGESHAAVITAQGQTRLVAGTVANFDVINLVDTGSGGGAFRLGGTALTSPGSLGEGSVYSGGQFTGPNGLIEWMASSTFQPGAKVLTTTVQFFSNSPFGEVQFINFFHQDVFGSETTLLSPVGTPGDTNYRLTTLDKGERVGFHHGGVYQPLDSPWGVSFFDLLDAALVGATWQGWSADRNSDLLEAIEGNGISYSQAGAIDTTDLVAYTDPLLGQVYGTEDLATAFSWKLNPTANEAKITTFVTLIAVPDRVPLPPVAANDSAVTATPESVTIHVLNNDSYSDGFLVPATVTIISQPENFPNTENPIPNGIAYANDDGTITYDPGTNTGDITFAYTVSDDNGLTSNPATVTVRVSQPPLVADDRTMTLTGQSVTIDVLNNDRDDGFLDPTSVRIATPPSSGQAVSHADGTFTYLPAAGFTGRDTFTYTVKDNDGAVSPREGIVRVSVVAPGTGLVVSPLHAQNPVSLAEDITGGLLPLSNVTYHGNKNSAGMFVGGAGIIGFESGIVLGTGEVIDVVGPNLLTGHRKGVSTMNDLPGDRDLNELIEAGDQTHDATVLEFDFLASGNTLVFNYVFGSDEYNEWVYSYNDVFGFFLDGVNIALIPNTTTPVSIDTVNLTANPALYRNNDHFAKTPINSELDGLTQVLTATAQVTPGRTHRIKLAIADTNDMHYDSAVFIQFGSFTTTPPVAVDDVATTTAPVPVKIRVLDNDYQPDGALDVSSVRLVTGPSSGGAVVTPDGTIVYTPDASFTGDITFTYAVRSTSGATSNQATVTVTVAPPAVASDPPNAVLVTPPLPATPPVPPTDLPAEAVVPTDGAQITLDSPTGTAVPASGSAATPPLGTTLPSDSSDTAPGPLSADTRPTREPATPLLTPEQPTIALTNSFALVVPTQVVFLPVGMVQGASLGFSSSPRIAPLVSRRFADSSTDTRPARSLVAVVAQRFMDEVDDFWPWSDRDLPHSESGSSLRLSQLDGVEHERTIQSTPPSPTLESDPERVVPWLEEPDGPNQEAITDSVFVDLATHFHKPIESPPLENPFAPAPISEPDSLGHREASLLGTLGVLLTSIWNKRRSGPRECKKPRLPT